MLTSTLIVPTKEITGTLVISLTLTWLTAKDYFRAFILHESFKSYAMGASACQV
jgi:hypothetical protein